VIFRPVITPSRRVREAMMELKKGGVVAILGGEVVEEMIFSI